MRACEPEKRRFWEEHLKNWELSGESQVEYCRKNGINIKSFHYWKRRIGRSYCAPAMVELPISWSVPVTPASPQLCLVFDRFRVEIGKGFDPEDLERVVRVLGRI